MTGGTILGDEYQSSSATRNQEIPNQDQFILFKSEELLLAIVLDTYLIAFLHDEE